MQTDSQTGTNARCSKERGEERQCAGEGERCAWGKEEQVGGTRIGEGKWA